MVDLALLQSVSYIAGAMGVCVAAIYYVMVLREQRRNTKLTLETRQAQLLMNIYERWSKPEFQEAFSDILTWEWKDLDDYMRKYGSNKETNREVLLVASMFEGLGVYVKRGFIDASLVDDLMSHTIVAFWQKMSSVFLEYRRKMNSPTNMEYAEYLYNVIYEIWKREHPETPTPLRTQ